jgi:hypothetical protein
MHPITDKAEVAIDFPTSSIWAVFGRDSAFEAKADDDGLMIRLVSAGSEKRTDAPPLFSAGQHLDDLAGREPIDEVHRQPLMDAARRFAAALGRGSN